MFVLQVRALGVRVADVYDDEHRDRTLQDHALPQVSTAVCVERLTPTFATVEEEGDVPRLVCLFFWQAESTILVCIMFSASFSLSTPCTCVSM